MEREGWAPAEAIGYIRGGYCPKAIESASQEDMVEDYYKKLKGIDTNADTHQQLH